MGFIKRIIPFLVTLTVGLFIASFFVDLAPRPLTFSESRRGRRYRELQELYMQEHEARIRAEEELDRLRQNPTRLIHEPWTAPNEFVPPPPTARAPRSVR